MSVLQSHSHDHTGSAGHRKTGRLSKILAALAGLALLASACTAPPPPAKEDQPQITFTHLPPIRLATRAPLVKQTFQPRLAAPSIEHTVPVAPLTVLKNWVRDRIKTGGGSAGLTIDITDASMVETPLPRKGDLRSALKSQPVSRINGRLAATLSILGDDGSTATASVVTERSQVLHDQLTLVERDQKLLEFVEAMGKDLNQRMELEIHRHLGNYVTK